MKYLLPAIAVLLIAGCESISYMEKKPPLQVNDSKFLNNVALEESDFAESSSPVEPTIEESSHEVNIGVDELNRTIIDDFEKKKMLIDLECQSDFLKIRDRSVSTPKPTHDAHQRFLNMKDDAERVIDDLTMRLDSNPDETLSLAYKQEIARLKLEYEAARVKDWINEIETIKRKELEEIDKSSSAKFECDIRYAENEAERDRMLYIAKMSAETNDMYEVKLNKLDSQLSEIEAEIDSVNEESFDGVF